MKKIALLLIFMLAVAVCGKVYAQQKVTVLSYDQVKSNGQAMSFDQVDEKPKFQGTDASAFGKWVIDELKYPAQAAAEKLSGRVVVKFSISKDGSVKDVKVLRSVHPVLDAETVRVISMSPKWEPGKVKGEPVDVTYIFPVVFKHQSGAAAQVDGDIVPSEFISPYKEEGSALSNTAEFTKWAFMNVQYPAEAKANGIMGRVHVMFEVLEDGTVDNVRVAKSAHPLLDEEIVRVVKLSPKWKPAQKNGTPVKTTITFPFVFQLR